MSRFIGDMSRDLGLDPDDPFAHIDELNTEPQLKDFSKLLAKCYLKRAEWMVELDPNWAVVRLLNWCAVVCVFLTPIA